MNVLDEIVSDQLRTDLPEIASGDTVKVSAKVVEGNRERIQVFEGVVMRLRGGGITRSITVRRIASGVGVERTFKIHSPRIDKIEVVRHGQVRRAQLYFLRKRVGKAATLRERRPKGWSRPARGAARVGRLSASSATNSPARAASRSVCSVRIKSAPVTLDPLRPHAGFTLARRTARGRSSVIGAILMRHGNIELANAARGQMVRA